MPARPGAAAPAKPATPAAAPAASGASRWLAPIAGLAAGLGLAALLSHFGLSEEFGSLLLLLLLVGGAVFVLRMLVARRAVPSRPLQYAGGAGSTGVRDDVRAGASSSGAPRIEPAFSPAPAAGAGRFPPGFDAEAFVRNAKQQFIALQAAHDAADRKALRDVMTPKLYAEITKDLPEAGTQRPTEVVTLDADVLEVATEGNEHWASVRYSGTLREDGSAVPASFDEVWHLTKPIDGSSGWLLAGIQQRN
jgi:predicted lipid-binding transport protein (Tim44 family)